MPGFFPGARENIAVPDDRKGQIVFKWPDHEIRRFTHAIVAPDELAVFMYQGQVKGTLPPGRHSIDATELPFLGIFADALTGGNLYRAELYFVGNREFTQNRFGGKIDSVQDPVSTLIVSLRVFGDYSLKVIEPASLLVNLVGTVDVTDNTAVTNWVAEQLLKVLRTDVTKQIVRNGWPILGLAAYTEDIEKAIIELANQQLATYGLTVARMGNFTISLDDESQKRLEQFSKDTAYSRLAGSFQGYAAGEMALGAGQGMAQGGGAVSPAFMAAGFGLGGQMAQPIQAAPAPPAGTGFPGARPGHGRVPAVPRGEPGRRPVLSQLRRSAGGGSLHRLRRRAGSGRALLRRLRSGRRCRSRRTRHPCGASGSATAARRLRPPRGASGLGGRARRGQHSPRTM
jgi:membrane protease subunit (stomatin/prohibitin family)